MSAFFSDDRRGALAGGKSSPPVLSIIAVIVAPTLVISAVALQPFVPVHLLLRDPLDIASSYPGPCCPLYYGAISNLGILLWTATAAVALFAAGVAIQRTRFDMVAFPLAAGALTGLMAVDDFFMLHERAFPEIGLPEEVALSIYGALALAFVIRFRGNLAEGPVPILLLAVAAFGTSVFTDLVITTDGPLQILIEDGAKFTGIVAWAVFLTGLMLARVEATNER